MEMEYSLAEGVWQSRSLSRMPRSAGICRVEKPLAGSDSVCAVWRVFVMVKRQEGFLGIVLDPGVTFVARLPQRVVGQADEDGLDSSQRHNPGICGCRLTVDCSKYENWTTMDGNSNYTTISPHEFVNRQGFSHRLMSYFSLRGLC